MDTKQTLKQQFESMEMGLTIVTTASRATVFVTAKRAGITVTTKAVSAGLEVTKTGVVEKPKYTSTASKQKSLLSQILDLSTAKRLELFEHFELCCGMNRGACICDVRPVETVKPTQTIQPEPKDAVTAFIAKAQASKGITSDPKIETETVNEWTGWTDPGQTYDDQTGEIRTFRKHIKTGKVEWVDNESYQMEV